MNTRRNVANLILRHKSVNSWPKSEMGSSLIEVIVAAGIFSIAILGLSVSLASLAKSREKVSIVNSAITLQSLIVEALSDPNSYPESTRDELAAGNLSTTNISITYDTPNGSSYSITFNTFDAFGTSAILYFDRDLVPCAGGFANPRCVIQADVGFKSYTTFDSGKFYWKAAYHIGINPNVDISVGAFGAVSPVFATSGADHQLNLPDLSNKNANSQGCSPATDVAARGVDRDTGQVTCLKKADITDTCPDGTFPTKFVVDVVTNKLKLDCADGDPLNDVKARSISCNDNYALQTVQNSQVYDSRFAAVAGDQVCVFRGAESEARPLPGPTALSGPSPGDTVELRAGVCPRPAVGGVAYQKSDISCGRSAPVLTQGQCCTIAGCTGSLTFFNYGGADALPVATTFASADDQIYCSVSTTQSWGDPGVCDRSLPCPGEYPAIARASATTTTVGGLVCNRIALPVNQNATLGTP